MANVMYPKFKEAILNTLAPDIANAAVNIVVHFVDSAVYTPNDATDQFVADLVGSVAVSGPLLTKTNVLGTFDADDIIVAGVTGAEFEYMILAVDTGTPATDALICRFDTATGLPFTPSGNNVLCVWSGSGIFQL